MPNTPETDPQTEYERERVRLLKEHADVVLEARQRSVTAKRILVEHEMRLMMFDGMSPQLAAIASQNNMALRLLEVDKELEELLGYHQDRLRRALAAIEPVEDED